MKLPKSAIEKDEMVMVDSIKRQVEEFEKMPARVNAHSFWLPAVKELLKIIDVNPPRVERQQVDGIFVSQEDWNNLKFHVSRADNYKQHTLAKGLMRDIEMKAPFDEKGGS